MPNHIHGIIQIVMGAGKEFQRVDLKNSSLLPYRAINVSPGSLGAIVRAYKASVTCRINALRGSSKSPVWQRNYYDHINRDEIEHEKIWNYIKTNPIKTSDDRLYPE
jgi:putative transposase